MMQAVEILTSYSDDALDRLAVDKVDEIANLRLPRAVLIQEVASALSSLSYVAQALAPTRPPTYAFLKLLLDEPERACSAAGFRERVMEGTDRLTEEAERGQALSGAKEYELYLHILVAAWEDDGRVNRSEALLLEALRSELGIWTREHLLLEHHPQVRSIWENERSFEEARNHLLGTGLVLVHEGSFILPAEVARQVRQVWGIELEDSAYTRMLERLSVSQLRGALERANLPLSGSKAERIDRVIRGLVPPGEVLDALHIDDVKQLCRELSITQRANKAELIANLIDHFDRGEDLVEEADEVEPERPEVEPEPRELGDEQLRAVLKGLTLDLLYDILSSLRLRRSGSKAERIATLIESPYAAATLLAQLRRLDLVRLCRKVGVPVSGVKDELIDRLVGSAAELEITDATASIVSPAPGGDTGDDAAEERPASAEQVDRSQARVEPEGVEAPIPQVARLPETRDVQPRGLDEIRGRYPDLQPEEQIVLALLREARSLTEQEIERALHRHQIGWFLTKAHMADLVAELRVDGVSPIRVRSSGTVNIYEWLGPSERERQASIGTSVARDIVDALRHGVVPENHLDLLAVGHEEVRAHLVELLDHVKQKRSEFKFIRGPYGAGKTFMCSWLRDQALLGGFVTSTVRIGPDQPLSDLPVVLSAIVDGLRTFEKRHASALADILDSWLLAAHCRAAKLEGLAPFDASSREEVAAVVTERIAAELSGLADLDPGFAPAVRAFYQARLHGDHETATIAVNWIRGSRSLAADALRRIGLRGQLCSDEVFPRMRALLELITGGRFEGLVLVLDELELVRRFPHSRQREQAYETMRLLIDECGENRLPGCLLLCTGTDQLFEDQRYGLRSYQALAARIEDPVDGSPASIRQAVLRLPPLGQDRLLLVGRRVREVHGSAYGWPAEEAVADDVLTRLADQWVSFGTEIVEVYPRQFLRNLVNLLDLCQQNPGVPADDYLGSLCRQPEAVDPVLDFLPE